MNPVKYSIRDLERLTGVKAHTIRMWEKRYGVVEPHRTKTNIRYYSDQDLQKLLNVCLLNQQGYKISHIAEMSEDEIISQVASLSEQDGQVDADINHMVLAAIDLQEEQFDRVLNSCLLKLGFEKTFSQVIFPLFDKLAVMWQIGRINACQERFLTNLVRQKLLVATDGLSGNIDESKGLFLLFSPADQDHETGLLFANYLLRKNKYQVVYLGASVPFEHLRRLENPARFDKLLLTFDHELEPQNLAALLNQLRSLFLNQEIHLVPKKNQKTLAAYPGVVFHADYESFSQTLSV